MHAGITGRFGLVLIGTLMSTLTSGDQKGTLGQSYYDFKIRRDIIEKKNHLSAALMSR